MIYGDEALTLGLSYAFGSFLGISYYDKMSLVIMFNSGLKDKNGVFIYENDIIESDNGEVCIIYWDALLNKFCKFPFIRSEENFYTELEHLEKWEVVGNVYEPPILNMENKNNKQLFDLEKWIE